MKNKTECEHENGWVTKEEFVIIEDPTSNMNIEIECKCNNLDCNERRSFKFDLVCVEEVKE